jgi:HTH-type transcriptional regulator/antitoxin HigA
MSDNADCRTPGQLIEKLLDERGWSQTVLALILDCDKAGLNRLISGKKSIDAETALALGEVFGVSPERFLDLQASYDLARARLVARPDPGRATRAHLFGGLPIAEMVKRRWIDAEDPRDVTGVEAALARFFGANSPDEIEILPHAAKKTNVTGDATPAQLAWLYRVRAIARESLVGRYSPSAALEAVGKLRNLLSAAEEARKVPRVLAECGIRYVIVEGITGSKIDGVCFWLNDHAPVIAMSLRHDRIDNFWFVLRHELEHVIRLHGQTAMMLDAELEGERAGTGIGIPEEERVANEAAADFCVPQQSLERFIARKAPFFAERDILGFSRTLKIHPGLVAGQLQHKTGRYDRFKAHQVKIRSIVAPSALVDGWGDVAPVGE